MVRLFLYWDGPLEELLLYRIFAENWFKLKFCMILLIHNICISEKIILKICTEYGSDTAILCAKFQNNLTTDMDVMS